MQLRAALLLLCSLSLALAEVRAAVPGPPGPCCALRCTRGAQTGGARALQRRPLWVVPSATRAHPAPAACPLPAAGGLQPLCRQPRIVSHRYCGLHAALRAPRHRRGGRSRKLPGSWRVLPCAERRPQRCLFLLMQTSRRPTWMGHRSTRPGERSSRGWSLRVSRCGASAAQAGGQAPSRPACPAFTSPFIPSRPACPALQMNDIVMPPCTIFQPHYQVRACATCQRGGQGGLHRHMGTPGCTVRRRRRCSPGRPHQHAASPLLPAAA